MKIGLIDVDNTGFPNLALMKIAHAKVLLAENILTNTN